MKILAFALIITTQFAPFAYCQEKPKQPAVGEIFKGEKAPDGQAAIDNDYAWDEFNHRGRLIWDCRGVQSGKFVMPEFCAFKERADTRWPDKNIPGHWKPQ